MYAVLPHHARVVNPYIVRPMLWSAKSVRCNCADDQPITSAPATLWSFIKEPTPAVDFVVTSNAKRARWKDRLARQKRIDVSDRLAAVERKLRELEAKN
jgi:hypothetical protein